MERSRERDTYSAWRVDKPLNVPDWIDVIWLLFKFLQNKKIPTIYFVNIRPNRHSEIPKSKATYSRAANTKTNGENIYRKLKLERYENH
jgi:hypothetical protein